MDGEAVEIGVPGGIGDLGRGDGGETAGHGLRNAVRVRGLKVHVHHGGDALGHRFGGNDHHALLRQGGALLSGHDDIAVVGQDEHRLGGNFVHPL